MQTPRPRWLVLLCFSWSAAFALELGEAWNGPPADLGKPLGKIQAGEKTLYRWPELEVTVAAGRIVQIRRLDAASQAAEIEERARLAAEQHARLLAARKEQTRLEAERAAQAAAREKAETAARAQAEREAAARAAAKAAQEVEERAAKAAAEKAAAEREAERLAREARAKTEADAALRLAQENLAREAAEAAKEKAAGERRERDIATAEAAARKQADQEIAARAKAVRLAERQARNDAERAARDADKALAPTPAAPEPSAPPEKNGRPAIAVVKPPTDAIGKLEREISFLRLDLSRAKAEEDLAATRRIEIELRTKKAELEALRKAP